MLPISLMVSGSLVLSWWALVRNCCAFSNCPIARSDLPAYFHAKVFSGLLWRMCWQACMHSWWRPVDERSWMVFWSTECLSHIRRSIYNVWPISVPCLKPLLKPLSEDLHPTPLLGMFSLQNALYLWHVPELSGVSEVIDFTVEMSEEILLLGVDCWKCFVVDFSSDGR